MVLVVIVSLVLPGAICVQGAEFLENVWIECTGRKLVELTCIKLGRHCKDLGIVFIRVVL